MTRRNSVGKLERLLIQLPYDPAIPLVLSSDTCSHSFAKAAVVNQPVCPSKHEWPVYTVEYYSAIK